MPILIIFLCAWSSIVAAERLPLTEKQPYQAEQPKKEHQQEEKQRIEKDENYCVIKAVMTDLEIQACRT